MTFWLTKLMSDMLLSCRAGSELVKDTTLPRFGSDRHDKTEGISDIQKSMLTCS